MIAKFRYHRENFAGIAKFSLCHSEIYYSPMLHPVATVPLATVLLPAATHLIQVFLLYFPFSDLYFF